MQVPDVSYLLLASPPFGSIAQRLLEKSSYPPALTISDTSLSTDELIGIVHERAIGLVLVIGYGKILKQPFLDSVAGQVLNIHPSLLPAYRGPAPVVQTILDGIVETGVTLMEVDAGMDHGPVISQTTLRLSGKETATDLYEVLAHRGVELFLEHVYCYTQGEAELLPQAHHEATKTYFVKKEDGLLRFSEAPVMRERKVRAYVGWPGAWFMHGGKRLLVRSAHVSSEGAFVLDRVQPEGGREMTFIDYCNGKRKTAQQILVELEKENP